MSFSFIPQLLVNGLIAGSIYSLVAVGFSLIYTTCRFINFSHGAVIMLSAYMTYLFFNMAGLPFAVSILLALAFTLAFGLTTMRLFHTLKKRNISNASLLIISIGLLILIENLLLLIFGANVKSYSLFDTSKSMGLGGITITGFEVMVILLSALLFVSSYIFLKKSRSGKEMQAVSDEPELSESIGISTLKTRSLAVAIASLTAGIAGIIVGIEYKMEPLMGTGLMIKGFSGAVIGGVSSILGSVLGAFIVGIAENVGAGFLPSAYKNAISFAMLFLFLIFRPRGLLGRHEQND